MYNFGVREWAVLTQLIPKNWNYTSMPTMKPNENLCLQTQKQQSFIIKCKAAPKKQPVTKWSLLVSWNRNHMKTVKNNNLLYHLLTTTYEKLCVLKLKHCWYTVSRLCQKIFWLETYIKNVGMKTSSNFIINL